MSEPGHLASTRAVYDHSAAQYVAAVGTTLSAAFEAPLDRAVLDAFAASVGGDDPATVIDAGCGPGRAAAYLAERGLHTCGVDIAASMIDEARTAHPHIRFDTAGLNALPVADRSVRAVIYWYSIITTPPQELRPIWNELSRVLDDDGRALVAFQAGDGRPVVRPDAYGSGATLTLYRHSIDQVIGSLQAGGFAVQARIVREPELAHESTPQAILLVTRESR